MEKSEQTEKRRGPLVKIIITLLVVIIILLAVTLFSRIKTMSSINKVAESFYTVNYSADYKLDEVLEHGAANSDELMEVLSQELFFGFPVEADENFSACSAFIAKTPAGQRIMGRNFDYPPAGSLLVYCQPEGGYRSYSMVSLGHLGVSEKYDSMPETLAGKAAILASPYACVDGLNEEGLAIAVLELETEPTDQSTGKINIITTLAVRMVLDKCATTQEAITMLDEYDMHSSGGYPYHFIISDKNDKTAIVEWPENEMNVVEQNYVTNFQLSEGKNFQVGIGKDRYQKLEETLTAKNAILSTEDAMDLLKEVRVEWNGDWQTDWSVVYNLDDFTADICSEMDYDNVYHFSSDAAKGLVQ